jgi:hypothetical protein
MFSKECCSAILSFVTDDKIIDQRSGFHKNICVKCYINKTKFCLINLDLHLNVFGCKLGQNKNTVYDIYSMVSEFHNYIK